MFQFQIFDVGIRTSTVTELPAALHYPPVFSLWL